MKWIQALKVWNMQNAELQAPHINVWAIPKKNTPSYEEVKDIMHPLPKAIKQLRKVEEETQERNKARKEIAEYNKPKPKEKRKLKSVNIKI